MAAFRKLGLPSKGARVVVQGYGKVGGPLGLLLELAGMRVVAVGDAGGAIYNSAGLDQAALSAHVATEGTVTGFPAGSAIDSAGIWTLDCEVAVPASLGGVITADVAAAIRPPVLVEAANGPTTPEADGVLADRGVWSFQTSLPTLAVSPPRTSSGAEPSRCRMGRGTCCHAAACADGGRVQRGLGRRPGAWWETLLGNAGRQHDVDLVHAPSSRRALAAWVAHDECHVLSWRARWPSGRARWPSPTVVGSMLCTAASTSASDSSAARLTAALLPSRPNEWRGFVAGDQRFAAQVGVPSLEDLVAT
jgi:hypothetical protein